MPGTRTLDTPKCDKQGNICCQEMRCTVADCNRQHQTPTGTLENKTATKAETAKSYHKTSFVAVAQAVHLQQYQSL